MNIEKSSAIQQQDKKPRRRMTKEEYKTYLMNLMQKWIREENITAKQALERLTVKQFDFLVESGIDTDKIMLTAEQLKDVTATKRAQRRLSPNGYNKRYPPDKQHLFHELENLVISQGATVEPREKENFGRIDFTWKDKKYRIVLSNPKK